VSPYFDFLYLASEVGFSNTLARQGETFTFCLEYSIFLSNLSRVYWI